MVTSELDNSVLFDYVEIFAIVGKTSLTKTYKILVK